MESEPEPPRSWQGHPSDFSPAARPAFSKALELAKANRARLLVAHVLTVLPMIPDGYIAATTYDKLRREQRTGAQEQLDRLVRKAKAAGVRTSGILLDFGVGSVAARVVATAACPVLTVHA
jgi:nucleotide-binding universal stress UspA family protein